MCSKVFFDVVRYEVVSLPQLILYLLTLPSLAEFSTPVESSPGYTSVECVLVLTSPETVSSEVLFSVNYMID